MNRSRLLAAFFLSAASLSASRAEEPATPVDLYTTSDNICFNEGSVAFKGGVLLSNFGGDRLDPLNRDGKGYIVSLTNEGSRVLIPARGVLNAPKGMAVKDDCLFIADVGCVVVYNLKRLTQPPVKIEFPAEEVYVNDIIALDDLLLVSVTNTGHIYSIDVRDCEQLDHALPKQVATIPGANGLAEHEGTLYIASYNPNGKPDASNVIYAVDLTAPGATPQNLLGDRIGLYDGLAVSADGSKLYFTNWAGEKCPEGTTGEVGVIELNNGNQVTVLPVGVPLQGPADICISGGFLYIPDLPASKLYMLAL